MKIDTKSLCGHLRATLQDVIQKDDLQSFVGFLCNLDPNRFKDAANELQYIFGQALQGNFTLEPEKLHYFPQANMPYEERLDYFNNPVQGTRFRNLVVNTLLRLPGSNPTTIKLWASMTNLKSALIIDKPTRNEKYEAFLRIGEKTSIDEALLADWRDFIGHYIPKIINYYRDISGWRRHAPLWSMPESQKTGVTCFAGELLKVDRTDNRFFDVYEQMKHPIVNAIFRKYPKEAAEAVFVGKEVKDISYDIPDPYDRDLPIGIIQIAPKVAQKPRVVFQPLGILDSASRPLFFKLESIVRGLPTQGVHSHDEARERVQRIMSYRHESDNSDLVYSFDQSAFTDRFSYNEIQRPILLILEQSGVIKPYDIACCDATCNGIYESGILKKNTTVSFDGSGTPMGTPPSFMLASLSNDVLVAFAHYRAHGEIPNPYCDPLDIQWMVTGDDLIVFDSKTGDEYDKLCHQIGLKINQDKSIRSSYLAEFCGKYITKDGIFPKLKFSPLTGRDSIKELLTTQYSVDAMSYGWPEYSYDIHMLHELPFPLGIRLPKITSIKELSIGDLYVQALRSAQDLIQLGESLRIYSKEDIALMLSRQERIPHFRYIPEDQEHDPTPSLSPLERAWSEDAKDLKRSLNETDNLDELYKLAESLIELHQKVFPIDNGICERQKKLLLQSRGHIAMRRRLAYENKQVYYKFAQILSLEENLNKRKEVDIDERSI